LRRFSSSTSILGPAVRGETPGWGEAAAAEASVAVKYPKAATTAAQRAPVKLGSFMVRSG